MIFDNLTIAIFIYASIVASSVIILSIQQQAEQE